MYKISFCTKIDLKELRSFINRFWKKNHILARDINFFNWQHKNKNNYDFIIARNNTKIIGCVGIIANSLYSPKLVNKDILWLVNWVVNKKYPGAGLEMLSFLQEEKKQTSIMGTVGCNNISLDILKILGFHTGTLSHYFVYNSKIKNFKIIKFNTSENLLKKKALNIKNIKFKNIKKIPNIKNNLSNEFHKDSEYLINRYIKHPIYKYSIFEILKNDEKIGLFIIRIIKVKNKNVIRVVDYVGELQNLIYLPTAIFSLIKKYNAEYADFFFNTNLKNEKFLKNFFKNLYDEKNIIPNYFEPFIKKNIILNYAINSKKFIPIFKADCDQDRPN